MLIKRLPVVFTYEPAGAVTLTVIVQTALPAKVPAFSRIPTSPVLMAPPVLSVSEPPHVFVVVVFARVIPLGNASVKVIPEKDSVLGFVSRIVSREVPAGAIALGLNDFWIVTVAGLMIFAIREPLVKSEL